MSQPTAVLVSLTLVVGVALLASAAPRLRRPTLPARLDPYLRGLEPRPTRLLHEERPPLMPSPVLERLLRPLLEEGARTIERWLGGSAAATRRLQQAGLHGSLSRFRAEQVLWGLAGSGAAVLGSMLLVMAGARPPAIGVVGGVAFGLLAGVLSRDWWLTQQVERRQARMLNELPSLTDLICLAVTAGEAPRAAIERAVMRARGELGGELEVVLADLRAGTPFTTAMERLAARVPVPQVVRFVDGLVVAVERGTPLADVLRAQAADIREQRKRELIEAGGRREVLMLVPVNIGLGTCRDQGKCNRRAWLARMEDPSRRLGHTARPVPIHITAHYALSFDPRTYFRGCGCEPRRVVGGQRGARGSCPG